MKHSTKVTVTLLCLFFIAQIFGLLTVSKYIQILHPGDLHNGELVSQTQIIHEETALGPVPEMRGGQGVLTILMGVAIGTLLLYIIARLNLLLLWKVWFFLSVTLTSTIALDVYMGTTLALVIATMLAIAKIWYPSFITQNTVEMCMYAGIAVVFVSFFDVYWAFVLLFCISIYDAYAVWKSGHMVTLAKFSMKSNLFAGLLIPYSKSGIFHGKMKTAPSTKSDTGSARTAVLGGGDIAFPLLFSSVAMEHFVFGGASINTALLQSFGISIFASIGLFALLYYSNKHKFYPAMPFITVGCFIGYVVVSLF